MTTTAVLIDDDPDDLDMLRDAIMLLNPHVVCIAFTCPVQALAALSADFFATPEYIFIDINMPRMDGLTCLQVLRRHERFHAASVIVLSTAMESGDKKRLMDLGADHVFKKPDEFQGLRNIVGEVLGGD
jgi:DNA-binding response OmpR family regulator